MYNKEAILEECIKVIKEEKLTFFTDLCLFIEPSLQTLYDWEFEKLETIKSELKKNKLASKKKMRNKWEDSDNATLQIAAYKLIAEKEEIDVLTMNKVVADVNTNVTWNETRQYDPNEKANEGS